MVKSLRRKSAEKSRIGVFDSRPALRGDPRHLCLGRDGRVAAGRDNRINQFLQNHANRPNGIVVASNRIIDDFRIGVGIDYRHRWDIEPARFVDRVLLPGCINHDERIGQLRHFQNAVEVSAQFGAFAIERRDLLFPHLFERGRFLDFLDVF